MTKGYSVKRFWVLVQKALVCSISVDAHNNKLMVPAVDVDSSRTRGDITRASLVLIVAMNRSSFCFACSVVRALWLNFRSNLTSIERVRCKLTRLQRRCINFKGVSTKGQPFTLNRRDVSQRTQNIATIGEIIKSSDDGHLNANTTSTSSTSTLRNPVRS